MNIFEEWWIKHTTNLPKDRHGCYLTPAEQTIFKAGMLAATTIITRECCRDESGCCCNETTQIIKNEADKL